MYKNYLVLNNLQGLICHLKQRKNATISFCKQIINIEIELFMLELLGTI